MVVGPSCVVCGTRRHGPGGCGRGPREAGCLRCCRRPTDRGGGGACCCFCGRAVHVDVVDLPIPDAEARSLTSLTSLLLSRELGGKRGSRGLTCLSTWTGCSRPTSRRWEHNRCKCRYPRGYQRSHRKSPVVTRSQPQRFFFFHAHLFFPSPSLIYPEHSPKQRHHLQLTISKTMVMSAKCLLTSHEPVPPNSA